MSPNPPILIHALGRSGSNILLDCFDLTPSTHCRNEPHTFPSFPAEIHLSQDGVISEEYMPQHWDELVCWMGSHFSSKDRHHPQSPPKSYYRSLGQQLKLPQTILGRRRTRKALSILLSELQEKGEYTLPAWLMQPNWQDRAIHVLKVGESLEQHLPWILENRPGTKVIFLVRHPLGFSQSLHKRYYQQRTVDLVHHEQNCERLRLRIWQAQQLGIKLPSEVTAVDVNSLGRFEVVLWSWFVFHEIGYHLYSGQPDVEIVTYEKILAEPIPQLKKIYAHCNLPWDEHVEQAVSSTFGFSARLAQSFLQYWSEDEQQIANDVLRHSSMRSAWTDELWKALDELALAQEGVEVSYQPY